MFDYYTCIKHIKEKLLDLSRAFTPVLPKVKKREPWTRSVIIYLRHLFNVVYLMS